MLPTIEETISVMVPYLDTFPNITAHISVIFDLSGRK
jgi:hypothetical protein